MSAAAAFTARLDLLEGAGQITSPARRLTEDVVDDIEREFELELDEEHGAQLVTHLAMALGRLDRGEPVTTTVSVVTDELAGCPRENEFAHRVLGRCGERLGRAVPDSEIAYLALHLCALKMRQRGGGRAK
ncbi:PRD domain-containing protein [Georgenia sp. AZ-5]|uniref:PRD domain-containing protein n=1 Tax=Georgenia sp. AZ-5 TaxID=3367526 RepID=UPI003754E577